MRRAIGEPVVATHRRSEERLYYVGYRVVVREEEKVA